MPLRRPREVIRLLALAVDAKGDYFPGHSEGVAYLVQLMGTEAGMSYDHIGQIQLAAMIHDVGKLRVADAILGAPRRLTEPEMAVVRKHSQWGANIVAALDELAFMAPWILHHHEHFDGSGYPDGLVGESIPFESRILLVADAFHVMTSARPYRPTPLTRSEALIELRDNMGTQFCPVAVSLLADRAEREAFSLPRTLSDMAKRTGEAAAVDDPDALPFDRGDPRDLT